MKRIQIRVTLVAKFDNQFLIKFLIKSIKKLRISIPRSRNYALTKRQKYILKLLNIVHVKKKLLQL